MTLVSVFHTFKTRQAYRTFWSRIVPKESYCMAIYVCKTTLATINPSFLSIDELVDSTTFPMIVSSDLQLCIFCTLKDVWNRACLKRAELKRGSLSKRVRRLIAKPGKTNWTLCGKIGPKFDPRPAFKARSCPFFGASGFFIY